MISSERITAVLNIDPVNLPDLLDAAIELIESETGHYFRAPAETTDYLSGEGTRSLRLSSPPYVGSSPIIVSVTEQKTPDTPTVLDVGEYEFRQRDNVAWLVRTTSAVWRAGYEYVVQYTHGYDIDHLPREIEQVILSLIQRRVGSIDTGGLKSETYDRVTLTRFTAADLIGLDGIGSVMSRWKFPVFA